MSERLDLDRLAGELEPVTPLNPVVPIALTGLATAAAVIFVIATLGFRTLFLDASVGDPIFLLRTGLLAILSLAALVAIAGMARPAVGTVRTGWRWAAAAALTVPASAIVVALIGQVPLAERIRPQYGLECLTYSIGIGLVMGAIFTWWLRRGAPTSPERAGLVAGLASGSLGVFAYSMHCPFNDVVYIGLWYTLAIATTTLIGRIVIPPLIRW